MLRHFIRFGLAGAWAALAAAAASAAGPAPLRDLPVLVSEGGVLDLLVIARASTAPLLVPVTPNAALVYDVCKRTSSVADTCPPPPPGTVSNLYGGTRLQLQPGDLLKVHLVNRLPLLADSSHSQFPGQAFLALNPTNLHTHGLLVAPRYASRANPTYGDNVFVLTLNPQNGTPPPDSEYHSDVRLGFTDYQIQIPSTHPAGAYWFHPHVHGISSNQISSGLSGVITIGQPGDYLCPDGNCKAFADQLPVRQLLLKDVQVLADGSINSETDPAFCLQQIDQPNPPAGGCDGIDTYAGGRHHYTINGQPYPRIDVDATQGEIWRLTNASSNVIYNLGIEGANSANVVIQVLAIDGVAVQPVQNAARTRLTAAGGARFDPVPCPNPGAGVRTDGEPLCVSRLLMFPSSRVEVWVSYRDGQGNVAPPRGGNATLALRQAGYATGEVGGDWTSIDLAQVNFTTPGANAARRGIKAPRVLTVAKDAALLRDPTRIADALRGYNVSVPAEARCKPLATGHGRRVFLGTSGETLAFGMGYEEIDENGRVVPGTTQEMSPFNPDKPTICVPLGAGNTPVHERWEIINIADEDHNFHSHQVRFSILQKDEISGQYVPMDGILHDSLPLAHATEGDCESVSDWHKNKCTTTTQVIDVPFAVAGDFVYHCHILEHEDGGMMARIRVRSNP